MYRFYLFRLAILLTVFGASCQVAPTPLASTPESVPTYETVAVRTIQVETPTRTPQAEDPLKEVGAQDDPATLQPWRDTEQPLKLKLTPRATILPGQAAPQAVSDLASRLGIDANKVVIESIESSEFPIQDLGCPQGKKDSGITLPGAVIGELILLKVDGQLYEYHAHGRELVFCGER